MTLSSQHNVAVLLGDEVDRPNASQMPDIGILFKPEGVPRIDVMESINGVKQWTTAAVNPEWFSVLDYGAVQDGGSGAAATNRAAIQAAVDAMPATGGMLYFPPGEYYINDEIVLKNYVHMMGPNQQTVILRQSSTTKNAIRIPDGIGVTIEAITILGPDSGSGIGVYFEEVTRSSNYNVLRNMQVNGFGSDGIRVDHGIVSLFENVTSFNHGGHGFSVLNGTSVSFIATYAASCAQAGYNLNSMNYCALMGTAVDLCGIGYRLGGCRSISMNACGSESITENDATYNGTAFLISACIGVVANDVRNFSNRNRFIHVTGNSTSIILNAPHEETPSGTATTSLLVSAGSQVTVNKPALVTEMSLASGSTVFPDSTLFIAKSSDQIVNNSTALQDDSALVGAVVANATYLVNIRVIYQSGTVPDIKFAIAGPAGAVLNWTANCLTVSASGTAGSITLSNSSIGDGGVVPAGGAGTGAGTKCTADIRGILTVGATAGNVQLRWAQNTLDVSDTTVLAQSYLELRRVA